MKGILDFDWDVPNVPEAEALLDKTARACLRAEGIALPACANVRVTGDEKIREINREYRGVDRPTDVISFAFNESEEPEVVGGSEVNMLGDLITSSTSDIWCCFNILYIGVSSS